MAGSSTATAIVLLALSRKDGERPRVKDFHLSLHYSKDRVSEVLKQLVRDGWLTMERDEADRRIRTVHASDRLLLLFGEYQRFLFDLLVEAQDTGDACAQANGGCSRQDAECQQHSTSLPSDLLAQYHVLARR